MCTSSMSLSLFPNHTSSKRTQKIQKSLYAKSSFSEKRWRRFGGENDLRYLCNRQSPLIRGVRQMRDVLIIYYQAKESCI